MPGSTRAALALGNLTWRSDAIQKQEDCFAASLIAMTAAVLHNGFGAYSQCVNAIDAR
jgi:hypothetical protein